MNGKRYFNAEVAHVVNYGKLELCSSITGLRNGRLGN